MLKPRLELAGFRLNGMEGNTYVGKNQQTKLEVFIRNSGKLAAEKVAVSINYDKRGVILEGVKQKKSYGALQPGEQAELSFPLFIQQSAQAGSLPIQMSFSQADFSEGLGTL